jgi:hypothetical protein
MADSQLRKISLMSLNLIQASAASDIGVAVDKGVVSLGGHVNSYAAKLAVIVAARRVKGVHATAENIEVHRPCQKETSDDQVAKRARDILNWDVLIPPNAVDGVTVTT